MSNTAPTQGTAHANSYQFNGFPEKAAFVQNAAVPPGRYQVQGIFQNQRHQAVSPKLRVPMVSSIPVNNPNNLAAPINQRSGINGAATHILDRAAGGPLRRIGVPAVLGAVKPSPGPAKPPVARQRRPSPTNHNRTPTAHMVPNGPFDKTGPYQSWAANSVPVLPQAPVGHYDKPSTRHRLPAGQPGSLLELAASGGPPYQRNIRFPLNHHVAAPFRPRGAGPAAVRPGPPMQKPCSNRFADPRQQRQVILSPNIFVLLSLFFPGN